MHLGSSESEVMWYIHFLETITRQTSSNIRLRDDDMDR